MLILTSGDDTARGEGVFHLTLVLGFVSEPQVAPKSRSDMFSTTKTDDVTLLRTSP